MRGVRSLFKGRAVKRIQDLFQEPLKSDSQGLVGVGVPISVETLIIAYDRGIFPWPVEGLPNLWFSPDPRGILEFSQLHIPRSLTKWMKHSQNQYQVLWNGDFERVIRGCKDSPRQTRKSSLPTKDSPSEIEQSETWITDELVGAYLELFRLGRAYCVEILSKSTGDLVAGLYGVCHPRYWTAESMFHRVSNTSKLALLEVVRTLSQKGITWLDVQMLTSVTEAMGAKMIPRQEFFFRITN